MHELLETIREAVNTKKCLTKWAVNYFYYNNGRSVDFDFYTSLPTGKVLTFRIPYEEGDNASHIGIKIMDYLSDYEEKYPSNRTAITFMEDLAWFINQLN